jgi:competence protein ComEA
MFKTIIAVLCVTVVLLITMAVVDRLSGEIVNPLSQNVVSSLSDSLQVTITGEVAHTGTYFLPLKSTLSDLLLSAGGATSNADPKAYDTSVLLLNKAYFYIAPIYDNANACSLTPINKVNVNSADETALKKGVDAFSSTVCSAIVVYRSSNGLFKQLEDLRSVTGIGPSTFEKCKNYVTLHE